jgi:hypothetical protein
MRRQALIGALLLIGIGVVLGATVFRTDIAQATGMDKSAQNVIVKNTPAQAVPVQEQNLDGGNIKVHEQGTANVSVTGVVNTFSGLPANSFSLSTFGKGTDKLQESCGQLRPAGTRWVISSIAVANGSASPYSALFGITPDGGFTAYSGALSLYIPAGDTIQLTFPQPYVLTAPFGSVCFSEIDDRPQSVQVAIVGYRD